MWTDVWTVPLPSTTATVPVARAGVRQFLNGHPMAWDAELVASELVSNAVIHGGGPELKLTVHRGKTAVRIEVTNSGSDRVPRASRPDDNREGGRGLLLVEQYSTRWGHDGVHDRYMTIWAELDAEETR